MQMQTLPLGSLTVGPPSWRGDTVRSIRRAERLVRDTRAGGRRSAVTPGRTRATATTAAATIGSSTGGGGGGNSAPAGSTLKCSDGSREGAGSDCVCGNKMSRPRTTGETFPSSSQGACVAPFPPSSLRELCAGASAAVASHYMRRVREVEAQLRRQAGRVTQEGVRLERERAHLQGALRGIRNQLGINRKSSETRTRRPATAETVRDGADFLLQCERRELTELKQELEQAQREAETQLQALGQSSKRLLDCARERARVMELLPHGASAAGRINTAHTFSNPSPIGPYTPECQEVLESSTAAVSRSQQLRETMRELLTGAISRERAAHCTVNHGLLKKIAETVSLQQSLTVTCASVRQAAFRKQREVNCIRHSHGRAQGPESSADILSRERLDRPLVQVYHRHPGTQLPEAARLIQGSGVLRTCLTSSEAELAKLQRTCLQLLGDLQGKRAAAQVDAGVLRMRRQQVDRRAVPSFLQQGASRGQRPLSCVE